MSKGDRAKIYPQKQKIFVFLKNVTARVFSELSRGLGILRASERASERESRRGRCADFSLARFPRSHESEMLAHATIPSYGCRCEQAVLKFILSHGN